MTFKEKLDACILTIGDTGDETVWRGVIMGMVADEREECAKVAEDFGYGNIIYRIAAAIRARSKE